MLLLSFLFYKGKWEVKCLRAKAQVISQARIWRHRYWLPISILPTKSLPSPSYKCSPARGVKSAKGASNTHDKVWALILHDHKFAPHSKMCLRLNHLGHAGAPTDNFWFAYFNFEWVFFFLYWLCEKRCIQVIYSYRQSPTFWINFIILINSIIFFGLTDFLN